MAKRKVDVVNNGIDFVGGVFSDVFTDTQNLPHAEDSTDGFIIAASDTSPSVPPPSIEREKLYRDFEPRILTNTALDRTLVSNQANKKLPFYSWFRYKEGFSEPFVEYVLNHILKHSQPGILLDPFSGSGSALFAASVRGWGTKGIELLPAGVNATQARFIADRVELDRFRTAVAEILQANFLDYYCQDYELKHIAITRGAFPQAEEKQLVGYISYCHEQIVDEDIRTLLLYAAMCILEEISYTRKDGQYLRWDVRSGRSQGEKSFNKGRIYTFQEAIEQKLKQMVADLGEHYTQQGLFEEGRAEETPYITPELYEGSCLYMLPLMESNSIDAIVTSPPYANRYDYTRTYALELVYLGCHGDQVKQLRQDMLSCTVENKSKQEQLHGFYKEIGREVDFQHIENAFHKQAALQEILTILDTYQGQGDLNNPGIASLVRNYFYEMCFIIHELARTLKPGGTIVMHENISQMIRKR